MTIEELGRATKQKYPDYASRSDAEVGQAVLKKYPEYQSRITEKGSVLNTVANLVSPGAKAMGEGVGSLLSLISPEQKGLEQSQQGLLAQQNQLFSKARELSSRGDIEGAKRLLSLAQQGSQLVGQQSKATQEQIASGQENLGKGAVSTALQFGSMAVPQISGATTRMGRIGQTAFNGATSGSVLGASQAVLNAETTGRDTANMGLKFGPSSVGDVLTGTIAGGVTGAAVQGVMEGVTGIKNLLSNVAKGNQQKIINIYSDTLKNNIKDERFYKQYKGGVEAVVKDSVKYDIAPTKTGVEKQLRDYGPQYGDIIENESSRLQQEGKRINLAQAYKRAHETVLKRFSHDATLEKQADNWFQSNAQKYKNSTNALPKTANELRKRFDVKVGDVLTPDAAPADAARKAFASELREEFKKLARPEVRDAIQKYQLLSGLSSAMQKEPKMGITEAAFAALSPGNNLTDLILGKAIRSPGLRRAVAQQGLKLASRPQIQSSAVNAKPFSIPTVSAIQRMLNKENEKNQSRSVLPNATSR